MAEAEVELAVVGGGCMGLAAAGELAGSFDDVVVFDRDFTGREATGAAGGMLAPVMELEFEEFELLELGRRSLEMFPEFCVELEAETGMEVGLHESGTCYVGLHERQQSELRRLHEYQKRLGLKVQRLSGRELTRREPLLSEQVAEGLWIEDEKHVDNRKFASALRLRCRERGVKIHSNDPVVEVEYDGSGRVEKIRSRHTSVRPETVVVAAGAWSGRLPGLKGTDRLPVRPVKGQAVAVGLDPEFLPECIVHTPDVYCVPHYPDRLIVGATMEEKGFDRRNRVGGAYEMLFGATEVLPGLRDQPFLESWVGHRPAAFDSLPCIGPSPQTENLFFATGHYRNGILHTPVTAFLLRRIIVDNKVPELARPFLPERLVEFTG